MSDTRALDGFRRAASRWRRVDSSLNQHQPSGGSLAAEWALADRGGALTAIAKVTAGIDAGGTR